MSIEERLTVLHGVESITCATMECLNRAAYLLEAPGIEPVPVCGKDASDLQEDGVPYFYKGKIVKSALQIVIRPDRMSI